MHGRLSVVRLMKWDRGSTPGKSLPTIEEMARFGPVWWEIEVAVGRHLVGRIRGYAYEQPPVNGQVGRSGRKVKSGNHAIIRKAAQ
jgi:hypothetical protein